MLVKVNYKNYLVAENEFKKINHKDFTHLKILEKVGYFEKLISIINETSCLFNNIQKRLIIENTTHGGFLPIQCCEYFDSITLLNTDKHHYNNILENLKQHNKKNIIFADHFENKFGDDIVDDIDDEFVIYVCINSKPDVLNTLNKNKTIVITDERNYKEILKEYFVCYEWNDLFIFVDKKSNTYFYNEFYYYITNSINLSINDAESDKTIETVIQTFQFNYDNLNNLCIMVKNGGPQFEKMLLDNIEYFDRWTILDTGSTDETIEIINKVLVGKKKGNLYQEPFINFRDSRNRLLDLAGTQCKFNTMLDDTYVIQGDLRCFLNEVRGDQYSDSFTLFIQSHDTSYGSNRIIKSLSGLRYVHKIHEVITDRNNINIVIPIHISKIEDRRFDYMEKRTMERKQLDLKLLYEEVDDDPNNPRSYYYLAQTYNILEDYEKAFYYFNKRCEYINSGFLQERYDAAFEAARLANFKLNKPWDECYELYNRAYKIDESRPEAMYFIGIHYYLENDFENAYKYLKKGFEIGYPEHCQYSLKPTLSFHFLPKFLARCCYQEEDFILGEKSSEFFLLKNNQNADDYQEIMSWYQIYKKLNIYTGIKTPNIPDKPIFCFVADGGFTPWSGSNILTTGVGGSETFIIEIARYIKKQNYFDVYVFCNTPDKKDEIFEGVIYKHLDYYYEFINTTYVKHCFISRFSEYLPLSFKGFTENVYFIIHDLTPSGTIIPIDIKLKNVFCLTEWHVDYFTSIFPQLKSITVPFYYGIDNKFKLLENVKKIKNKFIYSSFPNRGLLQLLQMWPKIYEKEPSATLHIYSDINNKWSNDVEPEKMSLIKNLLNLYLTKENHSGVFYHGWVDKKTLADAWITSDIWFYPCTFMETFCLTALEAASSKTLCITNHLAALQNTVGNRGVIIHGDSTTEEWQQNALEKIFYYMDNNDDKQHLIDINFEWANSLSWENQANKLLDNYIYPNHRKNIYNVIETINNFKLISKNHYHILKIGAYKGNVYNDITFNIINENTKAIFVEPVPSYYYELKENFKKKVPNNKYIFLKNAVSDKEEKIQIYYPSTTNNFQELPWWIEQIASSSIKHCQDHGYILDYDVININAITVKNIIELYNIQMLFCLMIDTEGSDFKILMSINFSNFKPLYIIFENMHLTSYHNSEPNYTILINYLSKFGYKIIYEDESDTLVSLL